MKKLVLMIVVTLAVVGVGMQLVPVERTNPPIDESLGLIAPQPIRTILERSCYDCHSHRTRWRWYSYVAPVSWRVAEDVREGREHMNFSNWGLLEPRKQSHKLEEIWEEVEEGEMPPGLYLRMNPHAALSPEERALLKAWTEAGP